MHTYTTHAADRINVLPRMAGRLLRGEAQRRSVPEMLREIAYVLHCTRQVRNSMTERPSNR